MDYYNNTKVLECTVKNINRILYKLSHSTISYYLMYLGVSCKCHCTSI